MTGAVEKTSLSSAFDTAGKSPGDKVGADSGMNCRTVNAGPDHAKADVLCLAHGLEHLPYRLRSLAFHVAAGHITPVSRGLYSGEYVHNDGLPRSQPAGTDIVWIGAFAAAGDDGLERNGASGNDMGLNPGPKMA